MDIKKIIQDLEREERETVQIKRFVCCPLCDKEILATSNSQLDYNIEQHLLKHERHQE